MLIREMRKEELAFAAECTAAEGWVSEDRTTLEGFFLKDPKGCLLVEDKGQPVGICVATFYGNSGFIGELIVRLEARGRGVGAELLKHGVRILKDRGAETIYLDGVVKAVELYERNGFHKVCRSWRFSGHLPGKPSSHVRRMAMSDLDQVCAIDKLSFGAERSFFLRRRFELFPELSHVMIDGERVIGYILGRGGESWVSAGPWVVKEDAKNPVELLSAFAVEAGDRPISIGILETNHQACDLLRRLGFQERSDSPWRMAFGRSDNLGASPWCYAVGTAAKG
jgi:GNAT superfamily N-acetyltransferase